MFQIELVNGKRIEVTEPQFRALVKAVFADSHPDKTAKIRSFHKQPPLTGWEKFQQAKRELRERTNAT